MTPRQRLLEDLEDAAYLGDACGVAELLAQLVPAQLTAAEARILAALSRRGDHPYQAAVVAAIAGACAAGDAVRAEIAHLAAPRALSPAQQAMLLRLAPLSRYSSPFVAVQGAAGDTAQSSYFGGTPHALPDEAWPVWDGAPMTFVCQLWFPDAPPRPKPAHTIALLSLYMDLRTHPGEEEGQGWLLRTYWFEEVAGLVRTAPPARDALLPTCRRITWQPRAVEWPMAVDAGETAAAEAPLVAAHQAWCGAHADIGPDDDVNDDSDDSDAPLQQALARSGPVAGCKLFGHAYSLQGNDFSELNFDLVLQLTSVPSAGIALYEGGMAYFGVATGEDGARRWVCMFEHD